MSNKLGFGDKATSLKDQLAFIWVKYQLEEIPVPTDGYLFMERKSYTLLASLQQC